ncbi:MAG: DUF192 domain-containing protein [Anaerolineae bacterium]|nr:DUF192 domain-containing protein [Anaerolineae bacterium]
MIRNATTGQPVLARAKWCASTWCRFRGLQLRLSLPEDEGLLFVYGSESIAATAIHMFFVFMSIGVIWLDASGRVVDTALAKPWRPYYAPRTKAQYFIEARPSILQRVQIGDVLAFDERAAP